MNAESTLATLSAAETAALQWSRVHMNAERLRVSLKNPSSFHHDFPRSYERGKSYLFREEIKKERLQWSRVHMNAESQIIDIF